MGGENAGVRHLLMSLVKWGGTSCSAWTKVELQTDRAVRKWRSDAVAIALEANQASGVKPLA